MVSQPFEKLEYTGDAADFVYAIRDHIYFATSKGTIYLVRYKLSNSRVQISRNALGTGLTALCGYRSLLLVADGTNSTIYFYPLFSPGTYDEQRIVGTVDTPQSLDVIILEN